jgi:gluconolactonase
MVRVTFDTAAPRAVLLSADERTLYVAEGDTKRTPTRELRAYPVRDDGSVGEYDLLHVFARDRRGPHRGIEGMALAHDGSVVTCAGSAGAGPGPMLYVFGPGGELRAGHPFPGGEPMRCAFGGNQLEDLYAGGTDGYLYRVRQPGLRGHKRADGGGATAH